MSGVAACALLAGLLAGCGAATPAAPPPPRPAQGGGDVPADRGPPSAPAAAPAAAAARSPADARVIARPELNRILDDGAQRFIARIEVNPSLQRTPRGQRFRGWEIVSFFPGDPRFSQVDLRPGDVVTRVNGKPIERPAEFIRVWEDLRFSRELVVDYLRDGRPRQLQYVIR
jgi:S1-C subfamily serine protease